MNNFKEKDIVKVRRMPKKYKWRTAFGVLFTGLSGELVSIINHNHGCANTYFVLFGSASKHDTMHVAFNKEELKLIAEYPICKNLTEPKRKLKERVNA